jgi:hypothetical protein
MSREISGHGPADGSAQAVEQNGVRKGFVRAAQ